MKTEPRPDQANAARLARVCSDAIREPGSYVDVATDDVYRIPPEAVAPGAAPMTIAAARRVSRRAPPDSLEARRRNS